MTTTIENKSVAQTAIELFSQRIKQEEANVQWVEENQSWIDEVGLEVHASGNTILFYSPTHEQVIRIIREIGGKWTKRYNASTISYSYHLPDYSRSFILCDSQPPGTCRMVPVVEIVPARWEPEKVINTFKLQCRDEDAPTTADVDIPETVTEPAAINSEPERKVLGYMNTETVSAKYEQIDGLTVCTEIKEVEVA